VVDPQPHPRDPGLVGSTDELRQAVLEGAIHRLRPKFLTEGVAIISIAPMLWASGVGAEVIRPMAAPVLYFAVQKRRWARSASALGSQDGDCSGTFEARQMVRAPESVYAKGSIEGKGTGSERSDVPVPVPGVGDNADRHVVDAEPVPVVSDA
jgi:hypothetical protein